MQEIPGVRFLKEKQPKLAPKGRIVYVSDAKPLFMNLKKSPKHSLFLISACCLIRFSLLSA